MQSEIGPNGQHQSVNVDFQEIGRNGQHQSVNVGFQHANAALNLGGDLRLCRGRMMEIYECVMVYAIFDLG